MQRAGRGGGSATAHTINIMWIIVLARILKKLVICDVSVKMSAYGQHKILSR
jgi:hypothetical protein